MAFTQYTTQLHPLQLQYGLALSATFCFSVLFTSDLVYSVISSMLLYMCLWSAALCFLG